MRAARFNKEVEDVLRDNVFINVKDISGVCQGMPMPTVYSKINKLIRDGRLSVVGKGKYVSAPRPEFIVTITPWMKEVNNYLFDNCVGINNCISEVEGNLFVLVHKNDIDTITVALKNKYEKVVGLDDFSRFPAKLEGYIVVGRLVSESPLSTNNGIVVPSLEKIMVDSISTGDKTLDRMALQRAVESHPVNLDSLLRYAARRGVKEEVSRLVSGLDYSRIEMMAKVQKYLTSIPVARAWVFGSFARGEETPESDLDLLVDYAPESKLSLLNVIRFKLNLESIISRKVDLVENGYLKPFAIESAERDKYLIYER